MTYTVTAWAPSVVAKNRNKHFHSIQFVTACFGTDSHRITVHLKQGACILTNESRSTSVGSSPKCWQPSPALDQSICRVVTVSAEFRFRQEFSTLSAAQPRPCTLHRHSTHCEPVHINELSHLMATVINSDRGPAPVQYDGDAFYCTLERSESWQAPLLPRLYSVTYSFSPPDLPLDKC